MSLEPRFKASDATVEKDESLYQGFFQLKRLTIRHRCFDGEDISIARELFIRPDAVCVVLVDPKLDEVVMVEQFRAGCYDHPESPWLLELVAGIVEPGESVTDVAGREAEEEAGVQIHDIQHVCRFTPTPGAVREYIDLLCARVDANLAAGVHGLDEEGEDILVHRIPVDDAFRMVREGAIHNAPSIIGLQWLELNYPRLKAEWGVLED